MEIYCVSCDKKVQGVAVFGNRIYPHREDLYSRKFFQCPHCGNYVGTHQDGRPLGTIPTPELRKARNEVHRIIDEFWLPTKDRRKRKRLYADLSAFLGREYHTGELNTIAECKAVIVKRLRVVVQHLWLGSHKEMCRGTSQQRSLQEKPQGDNSLEGVYHKNIVAYGRDTPHD